MMKNRQEYSEYTIDITDLWEHKYKKIDTPDGYQNINDIVIKNKKIMAVLFDNGEIIECGDDHLFQKTDGEWVTSRECIDEDIITTDGYSTVIGAKELSTDRVYDLEVDHPNHRYYSNGISSHNTGKTSLCHTLISELGAEAMFINASLNANMDLLRNKLTGFASTSSFDGGTKIVILDEADFISTQGQASLRGLIEEFSKKTRFILTCNYKTKLIEPLRNRLIDIDFDEMYQKDKAELIKKSALRAASILKESNVQYTKDDLIWVVKHYFPSSRKIINVLQQYSSSGTLTINKEELDADSLNGEIIKYIKTKDFDNLRKSCSKLPDPGSIFLTLYEAIEEFPQPLRPQIIIAVAKYQSFDGTVRDRLINCVACCTEILECL